MFINNAQAGSAQTELLFEMAQRWVNTKKHIVVISTIMTQIQVASIDGLDMDQYRIQKIALEQAVQQIRYRKLGVRMTIVRPGNIATSLDKTVPPAADVNRWASALVNIFELAEPDLVIPDLSLGPK
jgi:NADP-dependent 3-hydroxy acid dehydrogenase YdfG